MATFFSAHDTHDASSGPAGAWVFHRLLALVFLAAWWSLGVQVEALIGSRGLLPAAAYLNDAVPRVGLTPWSVPTVFWINASDTVLAGGIWIGAALALAAFFGVMPRLCFGLSTALYLSYATVARTFLSFQWDNLLLECGTLAVFLPADRPARWIHVLFRMLLFKLYFESGIAKWQSHLGDWQDGSAMTFYYETAPLPTWLAWFAHHLPAWWHRAESPLVLGLELLVPFAIFGPRRVRLATFAVFTAFQIANAATANYGFFCYLSAALGVFLLADRDVDWLRRLARRPHRAASDIAPALARARWVVAAAVIVLFIGISLNDAVLSFTGASSRALWTVRSYYAPWRLVNSYHLFGHITRDRIEPEFETFDGQAWTEQELRHKAGAVDRAPDFVAPHQPRLDFQLWFYGLSFQRGTPEYVATLLERLCRDPGAVQSFFTRPLPHDPQAVRIAFWQYRFSSVDERRASRAWWTRQLIGSSQPMPCHSFGS